MSTVLLYMMRLPTNIICFRKTILPVCDKIQYIVSRVSCTYNAVHHTSHYICREQLHQMVADLMIFWVVVSDCRSAIHNLEDLNLNGVVEEDTGHYEQHNKLCEYVL